MSKEQVIEIDEADEKALIEKMTEGVTPVIEKSVKDAIEANNESLLEKFMEKMDTPEKKKIAKGEDPDNDEEEDADDPIAKGIAAKLFTKAEVAESKEMRFFKAARALAEGDTTEVKRYNSLTRALRTKAGYANNGDLEDGGALVPDPEFDTTVYENLPKYGVAFQYADVRQTTRNSVRFLSLDSGLQFYETAEAGVKTGAKLQFSKALVDLKKYAVIVPATDELTDDAAIDFWNLVTKELSRAYARVADEITFTHATSGITNTSGVLGEPVSGAGTTITWDDLLAAEGRTEDDLDTSGARWFMRKETWFRLIALKGSTNDHYLAGSLNMGWLANPNSPTTPWGTPVTFTRVLPKSTEVGANDAFAVYGDLDNYVLYNKKGMALKVLTEATIVDSEGANFNLATQDGTAMRAVVRMLGKLPKGNASKFVIVGTGSIS